MGSRSRDTFKKRQKEVARAEKQQEKAARRMQRKAEKRAQEISGVPAVEELPSEESSSEEILPMNEMGVTQVTQ